MAEKKKTHKDIIKSFCRGMGERFSGIPCEYYNDPVDECDLLREHKIREIFEKGRCQPSAIVLRAVKRFCKKYYDIIMKIIIRDKNESTASNQVGRYIKSVAAEVEYQIRQKKSILKSEKKLTVFKGYINIASRNKVIETLHEEGVLWRRKCEYCMFLSKSKPYICLKKEFEITEKGKTQRKENPYYKKRRNRKRDRCKEGFEPIQIVSSETEKDNDEDGYSKTPKEPIDDRAEKNVSQMLHIESIKKMLRQRTEEVENKATRNKYERQYEVFTALVNFLSKGVSRQGIINYLADGYETNEKTIKRDISEIMEFIKMSDNI